MANEDKNQIEIPVSLFIRVTKRDGEAGERAMLIARNERGKEYAFMYYDSMADERLQDLTVCDMPDEK